MAQQAAAPGFDAKGLSVRKCDRRTEPPDAGRDQALDGLGFEQSSGGMPVAAEGRPLSVSGRAVGWGVSHLSSCIIRIAHKTYEARTNR